MDKQARYHLLGLETLEDRIYKVAAASLLGTELDKESSTFKIINSRTKQLASIPQTAIDVQPGARNVTELMQNFEPLPGTRGAMTLRHDSLGAVRKFVSRLPGKVLKKL